MTKDKVERILKANQDGGGDVSKCRILPKKNSGALWFYSVNIYFFKWAKPGLFLFIFVLFT